MNGTDILNGFSRSTATFVDPEHVQSFQISYRGEKGIMLFEYAPGVMLNNALYQFGGIAEE